MTGCSASARARACAQLPAAMLARQRRRIGDYTEKQYHCARLRAPSQTHPPAGQGRWLFTFVDQVPVNL